MRSESRCSLIGLTRSSRTLHPLNPTLELLIERLVIRPRLLAHGPSGSNEERHQALEVFGVDECRASRIRGHGGRSERE